MKIEQIQKLGQNLGTFAGLLSSINVEERQFREAPEKWNIHEVVCHLYDEEREDFRFRVLHALNNPNEPLPPINPEVWVTERKYGEWNFEETVKKFLEERNESLQILIKHQSEGADWTSCLEHPELGKLSAAHFLHNWIAHDFIHIRQINRISYAYLISKSEGIDFRYAGNF